MVSHPSVTVARSRPRRSTCSGLAFQRRGFRGELNWPLSLDGRGFPRDRDEVHLKRFRHRTAVGEQIDLRGIKVYCAVTEGLPMVKPVGT